MNNYIKDSEIFILEKEDKIIGIYVLQIIGLLEMEIKNIAVHERFQGQGIGKFY
ncbi:GNAT family N-acetyltransferase [Methanobacterium subterraneum]|uniref:GNAT family N-acetyltransferase n=1 Tax=Methanobacterium subterraneum TaxID=59277 RepID=UPI0018E27376|nr:GNAT family N-acetyltransferase [Methanobacterium sp. YSL]